MDSQLPFNNLANNFECTAEVFEEKVRDAFPVTESSKIIVTSWNPLNEEEIGMTSGRHV